MLIRPPARPRVPKPGDDPVSQGKLLQRALPQQAAALHEIHHQHIRRGEGLR